MQVIIICNPTHDDAKQQDSGEPAERPRRPNFLLFDNGGRESHTTPRQTRDTAQLEVPGHEIQMTFASHFAPQADNGNHGDEEFQSIGQTQPCRIYGGWIRGGWIYGGRIYGDCICGGRIYWGRN